MSLCWKIWKIFIGCESWSLHLANQLTWIKKVCRSGSCIDTICDKKFCHIVHFSAQHNCHNEEKCPPCVVLMEKLCLCGREVSKHACYWSYDKVCCLTILETLRAYRENPFWHWFFISLSIWIKNLYSISQSAFWIFALRSLWPHCSEKIWPINILMCASWLILHSFSRSEKVFLVIWVMYRVEGHVEKNWIVKCTNV